MILDLLVNKLRFFRSRSRHKTLRLKIATMTEFLSALDKEVPYVILRWHDRVPCSEAACPQTERDVDFLIDESYQDQLVSIASRFRGRIKCDFYGVGAQRGFAYNRLPYYPPIRAAELLRDRVFSTRHNFFVPDARHHLLTFIYHIVYHKGTMSGIPVCDSDLSPEIASRPNAYLDEVERIARSFDRGLMMPRTLDGLYEYLVDSDWQMPLDTLIRWKSQDLWHQRLIQREMAVLTELAARLPELVVFVIRDDASQELIHAATLDEIQKDYFCLDHFKLAEDQRRALTMHTRGGNWVEGRRNTPVPPYSVAFCVPRRCDGQATSRRLEQGAALKLKIRREINRQFCRGEKLYVTHSTDDALEAQYYLQVLYGDDRALQCERIASLAKCHRSNHPDDGTCVIQDSDNPKDSSTLPAGAWQIAPQRKAA